MPTGTELLHRLSVSGNHPRSSKENHPNTPPDRLTAAYLLGLIYGLTLCSTHIHRLLKAA
jgi:hypothetical protein